MPSDELGINRRILSSEDNDNHVSGHFEEVHPDHYKGDPSESLSDKIK